MNKPFNMKLRRDVVNSLHATLETLLEKEVTNDDDRLHFAVLAELKSKIYKRLDEYQALYRFTLTPAQAIALRLLYTDYLHGTNTYFSGSLLQIANKIHQQYQ